MSSSMTMRFKDACQEANLLPRLIGVVFVASGTLNIFGVGENTRLILAKMAAANVGTRIGPLSAVISEHHLSAVLAAAAFMLLSGLCELMALPLARMAAAGQLVMILAFVALLNRAYPEIFFVDGVIAIAITAFLIRSPKDRERRDGR